MRDAYALPRLHQEILPNYCAPASEGYLMRQVTAMVVHICVHIKFLTCLCMFTNQVFQVSEAQQVTENIRSQQVVSKRAQCLRTFERRLHACNQYDNDLRCRRSVKPCRFR